MALFQVNSQIRTRILRLNRIEGFATGPILSVVGSTTLEWWEIPHFTKWELANAPLKTVPFGSGCEMS